MVDVIGRAKVIVTSDVDQRSVDQTGSKIGAGLKQGALIGGAALATLGAASLKAFQAFEVAEAQSRKLSTVLGNMGESGAVESVEALADQLMRVTGIDDEVIKGGQTILATFENVASSAGDVGGAFERATTLSVDMASVFGSVESGARILGKALEDPEKAAARLMRSNVILNDEQKKLIENFVAAGDSAAAQDVILDALEDRYAGTAEAASTETQKIRTAFGELEESTGQLVGALVGGGDGDGKGGGLSGAIYSVSDAVGAAAESESWGQLGKDVRGRSSDIGGMTKSLFNLDKKIGTTILKLPGLGKALRNLTAPSLGFIDVIGDIIGKLADLGRALNSDAGDAVFGSQDRGIRDDGPIPGLAGGGPARGLRRVGENGPELVQFGSSGGYVFNNSQTRAIESAASGDTVNQTFVFNGPSSLSEARRLGDWDRQYGTRFGAATSAVAL
jgi:hypothetical protein